MKKYRDNIVIGLSLVSLVGLIVLQAVLLIKSAGLENKHFQHRVSKALSWAGDLIAENIHTLRAEDSTFHPPYLERVSEEEFLEKTGTDSILAMVFRYNHIDEAYTYELKEAKDICALDKKKYCCPLKKRIPASNLELLLEFPQRKSSLPGSMSALPGISGLLILLNGGCLFLIIRSLNRRRKMEEITNDFINNMTHELKTPIASVALAANMLKKETAVTGNDKALRYLKIIGDENDKLKFKVEQVLQTAQSERGDLVLRREVADLGETVTAAAGSFELQIEQLGGRLYIELPPAPVPVSIDRLHIYNVFTNLLDNAIKYSVGAPDITVQLTDSGKYVQCTVTDKGIGINKDNKKYIFNKFYRVSTGNVHNVKGFGLGLAYVKCAIDAHGGSISVKSEPGKGSAFEIKLPKQDY